MNEKAVKNAVEAYFAAVFRMLDAVCGGRWNHARRHYLESEIWVTFVEDWMGQ
jgi:hypothetical protein